LCKRLFSLFHIASNSFFESGSGIAVVGAIVVCTEGPNFDRLGDMHLELMKIVVYTQGVEDLGWNYLLL
jgi:hypothetical protein